MEQTVSSRRSILYPGEFLALFCGLFVVLSFAFLQIWSDATVAELVVDKEVVAPDPRTEDIIYGDHAVEGHGSDAWKARSYIRSDCPDLKAFYSATTSRFVIMCPLDTVVMIMILQETIEGDIFEVTSFTSRTEYAANMVVRDAYFRVPFVLP